MSRNLAQIVPSAYTPAAPPSVTISTTSATILAAPTNKTCVRMWVYGVN